jgi:ribosomal protein S18 acetylase RimI-like enzyme
MMDYLIRDATPTDVALILPLFPRLANFTLPERRVAEDLWQGDAELLQQWAQGAAPHCFVQVAVDTQNAILGVALVSLREELLSHTPSAHLEVLVVAEGAEGNGIGQALITEAETIARERGALSMTLHVFATNTRARQVYERLGYTGELIRYIKYLR